jgi:sterol desaturase/sphingolipid hydroxylase (fatty acid hydroxylase superfamily)
MQLPLPAILAIVSFGTALFVLERVLPLRQSRRPLATRLLVNVVLSGFMLATALIVVQPAVGATLAWTSEVRSGLSALTQVPPVVSAILAFLSMDLSFYYWHRLNHRLPLLWRFHSVHHVDPDLDVTTALRFHFGEIALSGGFRIVQLLIVGPSVGAYIAYEVAFQVSALFHHGNVRLPIPVERILRKIVVTPRMHGIHHSQVRDENRSNYGVVFPWWDKLHRTLLLNVPQSCVTIGIAGYAQARDNRVWPLLMMPFRRQRDYWTPSDGAPAEAGKVTSEDPTLRVQ